MRNHNLLRTSLLLIAVLTAACATTPVPVASCDLPSSKNLDQAFSQAYRTLGRQECAAQFDAVEEQLLSLAESAASPANRQLFFEFYTSALEQGLVTELQSKQRYLPFTASFKGVLPKDSSTWYHVRGKGLEKIKADLKAEMDRKERVLGKVLDDGSALQSARKTYRGLMLLLPGVKLACEEQNC